MSQSTIYDQATSAVVKMLETAGTDWHQPWQVNGSRNVVTDKLYRGVNTLILAQYVTNKSYSPQSPLSLTGISIKLKTPWVL